MASDLSRSVPWRAVPSLRAPLAFAMSCFLIWGLAYGLLDVLNKHFQETLHVGTAQSSWLQIAYFGAYLSMSMPAGALLQARGYKFGLVSGLVVTSIGALLFVLSAQIARFPAFVGSMFVMAAGLCLLETAADTYVNVLGPPEHAPRRLNLAQSFNALGVFLGPLIGGALFFNPALDARLGSEHTAVRMTYLVIALFVLTYALVLSRAPLPEIREAAPDSPTSAPEPVGRCSSGRTDSCGSASSTPDRSAESLWSRKHFIWGVITQALYIGAQVGIGAYFINLATETWHGLTSRQAAFLLSLATLGYLIGRFATTALLLRVSPRSILRVYGLTNVALCIIVAVGIEKLSTLALIAVFFFMGAMFATIFTLGVRDLGPLTKRGASMMVMAIGGGVLLPYPMGRIAESYGTPAAFLLPAISFGLVALYGWKLSGLDGTQTPRL
jgi:FHS family L-fucose permease-like MFS transporter